MDSRKPIHSAAATVALVAAWWCWRVLLPPQYRGLTILNYDLYAEVVPRLEYAFGRLARGELALWNPYQLAGTPFLATQQHGLLYPLNLPHLVLPLWLALSVVAVMHYAVAALSTAALARDLGASRLGAGLAAAAFAASGSMFARLYLPPHLYGAAWLPAQVFIARRLLRHGVSLRRVLALAAAFALQFVGGYPQYCLFAVYALAAYVLWSLARGSRRQGLRAGAAIAAALAIAAAFSAVQLLPTAELWLESPRRPGALASEEGLSLGQLLRLTFAPRPLPGVPEEGSVGLALLFLALLGATAARPTLLLAAVAPLLVVLAPGARLGPWLEVLPGYAWFRSPIRILVLAALFTGVLAAAGLARSAASRRELARACALPLAVFAAAILWLTLAYPELRTAAAWARLLWVAVLVLLLLGPVPSPWRPRLVAGVAVLELMLLHRNRFVIPHTDPDFYRPPADAVAYLRQHQGEARTLVAERLEPPFQFVRQNPPKTGMMAGVYAVGDYENLYPASYALYLGALQRREPLPAAWQGRIYANAGSIDPRLLHLLGVRFVLASTLEPFAPPNDRRFPLLFAGQGASVLANPRALPRAYLANKVLPAPDAAAALTLLRHPWFDSRSTITIEARSAPVTLPPSTGSVELALYQPERVRLRLRTSGEAFLVLTDQYYPGWQARLDGEPAVILRANAVFRALRVPAGEHEVEFRFAPRSLLVGGALSAISLLAAGWLLLRRRREGLASAGAGAR